jgi:hypothetical protein
MRSIAGGIVVLVGVLGCSDLLDADRRGFNILVNSVSPVSGEEDVSVLAPVTITLSRKVDQGISAPRVTLWDGARRITAKADLENRGRVLVLRPGSPLDFGTTYRVEISSPGGPWGLSGGPAGGAWEFTTEGLPLPLMSPESLEAHLGVLADDSMRGRGSGSPDERKAAEYLNARFLDYGLREPEGGSIQEFEAYSRRLDALLASRNVLAILDGAGGLKEEWIVVGAHYDHIGFRGLPDESQGPNNGADDNGSGTAAILEMARILKSHADAGGFGVRDRRSILFVGFGAEEHGLLGSCFYVHDAPAVPLSQTAAMLNFDMVGRLRDNTVFLSGGETAWVWSSLVIDANHTTTLTAALSHDSCPGCTDHACFWQAGIPFLGFFTGTHAQYHKPADDVGLINFPGMVRIGDLALRVLNRLMVMLERPILAETYPSSG